jgi:hypothetical protein
VAEVLFCAKGAEIRMTHPRILHVDVVGDHTQQGQLIGHSWPFAVQTYEIVDNALRRGEITQVTIRAAAGEMAEEWARRKRGNMALAYSRRTGIVLAQYCQAADGTLGFLLYTAHGRLEEQLNAHLFEPLPGTAPQEPGKDVQQAWERLPYAEKVPTCTYPVTDDAHTGREWWYAQRPRNSGLWVSVYPDRPTADESGGEEPLLTAVLEVYGGQLRILWWDRRNLEGDPHVLVVEDNLAAIPLTRLGVLQHGGTDLDGSS